MGNVAALFVVVFWRFNSFPSSSRAMPSLARTIRNLQRAGLRQWLRSIYYIGDAKFGEQVGTDQ